MSSDHSLAWEQGGITSQLLAGCWLRGSSHNSPQELSLENTIKVWDESCTFHKEWKTSSLQRSVLLRCAVAGEALQELWAGIPGKSTLTFDCCDDLHSISEECKLLNLVTLGADIFWFLLLCVPKYLACLISDFHKKQCFFLSRCQSLDPSVSSFCVVSGT